MRVAFLFSLLLLLKQFFAFTTHRCLVNKNRLPFHSPTASRRAASISLPDINYGLSDDEFQAWLYEQIQDVPGRATYDEVYRDAIQAIVKWRKRYRGNPMLWKRIFKKDRVIKELIEAAPIIDTVKRRILNSESDEKYTILDLCSGKGYLSMFLSEMLPLDKVERLVLIDKAWAIASKETKALKPHHMNWDHIYGQVPIPGNATTYFTTWPIPLYTSKQNLKDSCNPRQMKKHFFDKIDGPIIVLAIHLCGTLSLKAVDMFNKHDNVKFFALKPCCLPPMVYAQRGDVFTIGHHQFLAKDVCSNGSFTKKDWNGPPRWHLQPKFETWANHLFEGVDVGTYTKHQIVNQKRLVSSNDDSAKVKDEIMIQVDGGFQNTYIFAERAPLTSSIWDRYQQYVEK